MAIRPMLFIGCGGSGGVTLMYLMDSLRTELARAAEAKGIDLGPRILPSSWQFLHVDTPVAPDGARPNRPPTVPEQGGTYVGLAPQGLTYAQVARKVWEVGSPSRADLMSGWLKRPAPDDPPLNVGAGQMRNVGRAVTLDGLNRLWQKLEAAMGQLNASGGQLAATARALDGSVIDSPAVFVVSSMAGGSGASMVLDVCALLTRMNPQLAGMTTLFLYTSEVFTSLPKASRRGTEANGIAALGELLATSMGVNHADGVVQQLFGVTGAEIHQTFKRVIPVGNRVGQNSAVFGDGTQDSIYRAVGRGLAGLSSSPSALASFLHYDLGNPTPQPTDMRWIGEGSQNADAVLWGSFGFARLSLGRDRYGEYAAQRISRMAVDRLVAGHLRADSLAGEADLEASAEESHRVLLRRLGLPGGATQTTVRALLARGGDTDAVKTGMQAAMREALGRSVFNDGQLAGPLGGEQYLATIGNVLRNRAGDLAAASQGYSYGLVHDWHDRFTTDLLAELETVIASRGLATARQVVLRLKDDVGSWTQQLGAEANRLAPHGATLPPLDAALAGAVRTQQVVAPDHPVRREVNAFYVGRVVTNTAAQTAALLADVLADFGLSFADPLARALGEELDKLAGERLRPAREVNVAELRTAIYAEWPLPGQTVPERFRGAPNEVVLMDVDSFPAQFDSHVAAVAALAGARGAIGPALGATVTEATDSIIAAVITDRWPQHNDEVTAPTITYIDAPWVPEKLTMDPRDRFGLRSKSAARFGFRLDPAELLGRARAWVWRPDGEIGPFLTQGLRGFMDATAPDFPARRAVLADKFEATMQRALPLVAVDPGAFSQVHLGQVVEEQFKFSSVPFKHSGGGVDTTLSQVLSARSSISPTTLGIFDNALGTSDSVTHIDVFGSYAPMSPLAFSSLLQPLINAWREANAQRGNQFFWSNRRARPLPGCLAMSTAERRASIAGYVVGKLTGRIRGSYEVAPNSMAGPIEVYSQRLGTWLPFPSPLLTPFESKYGMDELPALLESQLIAIAECGFRPELDPLLPYVELRHLFATVVPAAVTQDAVDEQNRAYDVGFGQSYVNAWIGQGVRGPGQGNPSWARPDAHGVAPDLSTPRGRAAASLAWLESLQARYREVFDTDNPTRNPRLTPYDRRPMMTAIAPEMVWALGRVAQMVAEAPLDDGPGAGTADLFGLDFS